MAKAHGLVTGSMPRCFVTTNRLGLPYWGVLVALCFGLLAFLSVSSSSAQVFTWLSNLSGEYYHVTPHELLWR